jgi:hypothetical protein
MNGVLRNPVGVSGFINIFTQGSRCAATLGYPTKPLRGIFNRHYHIMKPLRGR